MPHESSRHGRKTRTDNAPKRATPASRGDRAAPARGSASAGASSASGGAASRQVPDRRQSARTGAGRSSRQVETFGDARSPAEDSRRSSAGGSGRSAGRAPASATRGAASAQSRPPYARGQGKADEQPRRGDASPVRGAKKMPARDVSGVRDTRDTRDVGGARGTRKTPGDARAVRDTRDARESRGRPASGGRSASTNRAPAAERKAVPTQAGAKAAAGRGANKPAEVYPKAEFARREGMLEGLPAVMEVNRALKNYAFKKDFEWCLRLAMGYNAAADGLPLPKEERVLEALEQQVFGVLKKSVNGHYVGHTSWGGSREFIFYVDEGAEAEDPLQAFAAAQKRPLEFALEHDPRWSAVDGYFDYTD